MRSEVEYGASVDMTSKEKIGSCMKVAIYSRCSTDESKQDLENQIAPLRDYAKSRNFEIVRIFREFRSGGDCNRPVFRDMLESARRRKFDVLLIWSLDRFSREGILNTMAYIRELDSFGVGVISLQEGWMNTTEPGMTELLLAIFSWTAQQERKRISERTRAGLARAKARGVTLGKRPKKIDFGKVWREYGAQGNVNRAAKILPYGYGTVYRIIKNNIHDQEQWEEFVRSGGCR